VIEYGKMSIVALTIRETPKITERQTKITNAARVTILMLLRLDKEKGQHGHCT
jgi:hypothetical protein